jgi:hypothetical protein
MQRMFPRAAVVALLAAFALPASAQAMGDLVDTAHFPIDPARSFGIGGSTDQKLAQTLTVEVGGYVAGVFLSVTCSTGRLAVELRNVVADMPGTTVLARQEVRADRLRGYFGKFVYVKLPGDLRVYSGTRLAIVVTNEKGSCSLYQSADPGTYAGGKGWFETLPNPPGWLPFSDFPGDPDDLPFQLVVSPI